MRHEVVSVTEFKAKCLALLDKVSKGSSTITITKRGNPLATVGPVRQFPLKSPEGLWEGKVTLPDDFPGDADDLTDLWDVTRLNPRERQS